MAKPIPITIPSDDCLVTVNGERYAVHEGETVTLVPGMNVQTFSAANSLMQFQPAVDAAKGATDEVAQTVSIADAAFESLCAALAARITAWTWTDIAGRPLPQPDGTAAPLMALEPEELLWLLGAVKGETPARRGNG